MDKGNSLAANAACAEYCRSQLEAHSFSYKPVPTTDEDGMRFHVVCLLLSTSGEVDPGYSPTTRIRVIWISPTTKGVFMHCNDYEERHMPPYKRPEPPPKPDDSD